MQKEFIFSEVNSNQDIAELKLEWLKSLTSPQDGMWESFRNSAVHWKIIYADQTIGYASVNHQNQLLQFYISPKYLSRGEEIFQDFIKENDIKNGIVGTNNPIYLSIASNFVQELKVHTYLFRQKNEVSISHKEGILRECQPENLESIINFCHHSIGAPKEWLKEYLENLTHKREIFILELEDQIIGTCEVRKSETATAFADIGMIVSPDHRRKGYGTFLLNQAAKIAQEWERTPICSCEKSNPGSLKSIHNCGFISIHRLLSVVFEL